MAFEHPSGLPNAFDRARGKKGWQSVVHYGERPFIQGAELNEAQTIIGERFIRHGRMIVSDGQRIEGGEAIVDVDGEEVTLTAGKVYAAGDVWEVDAALLESVPMTGRIEVGIRLVTDYITHEDDVTLVGLAPGAPSEGEQGAAREVGTASWAWAGDEGDGVFYAVYVLQDGTILDQVGPNVLAPAIQAIQEYDRPNGNYIVRGRKVTAMGADSGFQVFTISEGEANINGAKRTSFAAIRIAEEEDWDELAIPGETQTYPGGASHTFTVAEGPIGVINSILLTKEVTESVTRGAIANGADALSNTSVVEIVSVTQGGTTYTASDDFNRVNNTVDWAPAGDEPAAGSSYTVTYRYRDSVTADASTAFTITVSGGATGGDAIFAYTRKLPRVDRICLAEDGSPVYVKGVSAARNPRAPAIPPSLLNLARVENDWISTPVVVNDGTPFRTRDEMERFFDRIIDLDRLLQLDRLRNEIDFREPVAKLGTFVDPFVDDTYRDAGESQSGAIGGGMLTLAITPTFYRADLDAPVMLDWTEEVIITQDFRTFCEKINPYANFTVLPGEITLSPAADFWTETATEWTSGTTQEFNRGTRADGGPLRTTSTEDQLVDRRSQQLEFLREIDVDFEIAGFSEGEILETLVFDGIDVKPAGTQTADVDGKITGTFTIPANVTAGVKIVYAESEAGTSATALFAGQGVIEIDVMRQVTTINTWTQQVVLPPVVNNGWGGNNWVTQNGGGGFEGGRGVDPQAQGFVVTEPRQIVGIDFHLCAIGDTTNHIVVNQVTTDNGYPTADNVAEAFVSMTGAAVGWKQARYRLPITTRPDTMHAHVVKTDDDEHSISFAKLGGFDADKQQNVTRHPYVVSPRFSSVNARTWTAHQDEAMAFRTVAAVYGTTTKTVELGEFDLVDCSDLQVRAAVEIPSAACSVEFEIERPNGTIYRLAPFQVLQLTEYITETVELRAVLRGTNKLSPILFAPVELIAGEIAEELTYVTRAFTLGTGVRLATYLKAFLPGGSSLTVEISKDGGSWVNMPLDSTEALAFPQWTERKYELTGQTADLVRLKITGTGGPAARIMLGDLGAGIM
ncbi:DUF4815 domain-containing protein [Hoeflea sp.]|uniref:DUF4815 domain-containing protein n=1 Tax=Hoeflea sp. TaxID=1940281 RepID=UPI003B524EAF